ncbi:MAG: xylulokinase, partial [Candidatus Obscuribacterales bacterium]|nr:xylulokinase [Candidatus Obscuribacterales bacterium]
MSVFIGIDIGTSGTKSIAINGDGRILAEATASYPLYQPKPLWSEQDPDDWWKATVETVTSVVKSAGLKPADVKSIGLSGQMHGAVFLDNNQQVIRRAILWNDQRTATECLEIERLAGSRAQLIQLVANPALTGFTAPKILWLRNNEPANFARVSKVLLPKDEIRRRLTGEFATDVSDASGMLLFDVARRTWSKTLLTKLDLPNDMFAHAYESKEVTGKLTAKVAELLGLTTDCLVVAGAGDCAAGAIGNGIVHEGLVSTSIGSSGVVFAHSENFAVDPSGRLHTFCHAVKDKWHLMGVTLAAGASLQWFRNNLCLTDDSSIYEKLTSEARAIKAGSDGLFFLPYLSGERTPYADPDARGSFIGLTLSHSRGHLVRSIMEGVAYSLNDSLAIMRELNISIEEIRASGGGAKSDLWRQIQADVFNESTSLLAAEHGAAYGVALLAAVGTGAFTSIEEACEATISVRHQSKPDTVASHFYKRAFPIYQSLYHSLKDNFKQIAALESDELNQP